MTTETTETPLEHIEDPMEIVIVAAVAANGIIGQDGEIPWHIPEDLQRFRDMTTGHPVIMGRRTHESIVERNGHSLPNRDNIVLTTHHRNQIHTGDDHDNGGDVYVATSIPTAIEQARQLGTDTVYVIGGETVYRQFLDYADRLELTEIHDAYEGDTAFPDLDGDWEHTDWEQHSNESVTYSFVTYERTK